MAGVLLLCVVAVLAAICGAQRINTGQGAFTYEYMSDRLTLPPSVRLQNGHGLARGRDGSIFFTYESTGVQADTRALIRFAPDGTGATLLGPDNELAYGTPHGLRIAYEGGTGYLYHSNNQHTVYKTTLDGTVVWKRNETQLWENTKFWPFNPTDAFVPPESVPNRQLYVTDGYGKGFVHGLSLQDGAYDNYTFGGTGSTTVPPLFSTPHGINYDPRKGLIVVADRANHRLMYINLDGTYNSSSAMPQNVSLPCNVDYGFDSTHALVPNLGSYTQLGKASNGTVAVLDANDNVVSVLEIARLLGDKGHMHPHDAIFLENGDVVVCCWSPGTISYWRRMGPAERAAHAAGKL